MVTVTGTFDGKQLHLDQLPQGIAPNTRVKVTIEEEKHLTGLEAIAAKARKTSTPSDFAAQHHHYVDGQPRR